VVEGKAARTEAVEVKSSFDVPDGKYVARLVLRDSEGQMMGAQQSSGNTIALSFVASPQASSRGMR
jgi:hypothetical protein